MLTGNEISFAVSSSCHMDYDNRKCEEKDEVEAKYHATPKTMQHYVACVRVWAWQQ